MLQVMINPPHHYVLTEFLAVHFGIEFNFYQNITEMYILFFQIKYWVLGMAIHFFLPNILQKFANWNKG